MYEQPTRDVTSSWVFPILDYFTQYAIFIMEAVKNNNNNNNNMAASGSDSDVQV